MAEADTLTGFGFRQQFLGHYDHPCLGNTPALPAGMSISAGTISGTPSVYALNQTYTIYANQSGYSTTHELCFGVDTTNAHTVVENHTIDPIASILRSAAERPRGRFHRSAG